MEEFDLEGHEYVSLCDLLKLSGWTHSGGSAKNAIADGYVEVDGKIETRKRCKIRAGQIISFEGQQLKVV